MNAMPEPRMAAARTHPPPPRVIRSAVAELIAASSHGPLAGIAIAYVWNRSKRWRLRRAGSGGISPPQLRAQADDAAVENASRLVVRRRRGCTPDRVVRRALENDGAGIEHVE